MKIFPFRSPYFVAVAALLLLTGAVAVGGAILLAQQSAQAVTARVRSVGYWTQAAALPQPAVSQAAVLLSSGDPLIMGGEAIEYGAPTRTVQRYEVASGKWKVLSPMPVSYTHLRA